MTEMYRNDPRKDIEIYKEEISAPAKFRKLTPVEEKKIKRREMENLYISDNHTMLDDISDIEVELLRHPSGLVTKLMDYQLYGISWMKSREKSDIKGGILADQMGMGKTIQTIGLLLLGTSSDVNLIILPSIALNQWIEEIERHAPGMFNIMKNYGNLKMKTETYQKNQNKKIDIILTTYGTVENEYRRKSGILYSMEYTRIILDEAHYVKDSRSKTSSAISLLKSKYRWALTGTPVQNRVGDLLSLVKFLKLFPFSHYFCKKCSCTSIHWLRYNEKDESHSRGFCVCGHFGAVHFSWWNRNIATPIKEFGYTEEGKAIFDKLHKFTKKIILRRTKLGIEAELGLPSKVVSIDRLYINEKELDFYKSLYSNTKSKYDEYNLRGEVVNHYAHIFDLLLKMRLAANHPYLVYKNNENAMSDIPICGFCNEECDDPVISKCKHVFCREEAKKFLLLSSECPVCKIKITIDLNQVYEYKLTTKLDPTNWMSSTKIEYLIEQLTRLNSNKNKIEKSIVFSQYVNFLEILRWRLERAGFRCVTIYGNMPQNQRKAAIEKFNNESEITVFLISLKAGGVALNLTEANNVFLMDLWWNPAVEEQAMDRIHRIGQHRPIRIHRIIIQNSIESKILELQKKKKVLFESAVEQNYGAVEKINEEDLHFLFS
ncbi:DNA repair protein RAD16 [Vairimorpha necatrix]|uniref:DNA repair protein RAD16 n=1 Tax=Vairimorpha necatrix TaxID=6039 RepID=A0AAX4JGD4_9MICR